MDEILRCCEGGNLEVIGEVVIVDGVVCLCWAENRKSGKEKNQNGKTGQHCDVFMNGSFDLRLISVSLEIVGDNARYIYSEMLGIFKI